MLKFVKYWLWDIDDPPDRMGWVGFAILGAFTLLAAFMWFNHSPPQVR